MFFSFLIFLNAVRLERASSSAGGFSCYARGRAGIALTANLSNPRAPKPACLRRLWQIPLLPSCTDFRRYFWPLEPVGLLTLTGNVAAVV